MGGLTSGATNSDHSRVNYAAAALNATAGATQLASAFLGGNDYFSVATTSSVAWGMNAMTHLAKATHKAFRGGSHALASAVEVAGSLLQTGGAVAAGVGAYKSHIGSAAAVPAGVASGVLWGAGALAQGVGA